MTVKRLSFGRFNGERGQGVDLSEFSVAKFVDRPEETIPWHMHEDAHFFILLKGTYISSAEGVDGPCAPPTVIFVPAGTTHRDRFQTRGGSFLTVSLAPALISRLGGHATLVEQAFGSSSGELPWLGSKVHRELRQSDEVSPIVLEGLALELLGSVVRQRTRRRTAESGTRTAYELIQDGYVDKLTVQGIAATVGVRPQTLARSFRTAFGCSPGEMLRRRRIAHAEELLRAGGMPIAEIALASGFADQPQLTKAFRRVTGLTPGGFRKLLSK